MGGDRNRGGLNMEVRNGISRESQLELRSIRGAVAVLKYIRSNPNAVSK